MIRAGKEKGMSALTDPEEKFVTIKGKKMRVWYTGKGEKTFLLLPGSGVCCPEIEYGKLIRELKGVYRILLIEKFGYGESDIISEKRDLDTVLEEYRQAAQTAGIHMPVGLIAHSMGFLEAMRWAQLYPQEIRSIVGIDPAVPESYNDFPIEQTLKDMQRLREHPALKKLAALYVSRTVTKKKDFSREEKEKLKRTVKKNYLNDDMISEAECLPENLEILETLPKPVSTPMYFFISNGRGTSMDRESWRNTLKEYLLTVKTHGYRIFDAPHNLQAYVYREIGEEMRRFADNDSKREESR